VGTLVGMPYGTTLAEESTGYVGMAPEAKVAFIGELAGWVGWLSGQPEQPEHALSAQADLAYLALPALQTWVAATAT